jgi:hypothetical protein
LRKQLIRHVDRKLTIVSIPWQMHSSDDNALDQKPMRSAIPTKSERVAADKWEAVQRKTPERMSRWN